MFSLNHWSSFVLDISSILEYSQSPKYLKVFGKLHVYLCIHFYLRFDERGMKADENKTSMSGGWREQRPSGCRERCSDIFNRARSEKSAVLSLTVTAGQ